MKKCARSFLSCISSDSRIFAASSSCIFGRPGSTFPSSSELPTAGDCPGSASACFPVCRAATESKSRRARRVYRRSEARHFHWPGRASVVVGDAPEARESGQPYPFCGSGGHGDARAEGAGTIQRGALREDKPRASGECPEAPPTSEPARDGREQQQPFVPVDTSTPAPIPTWPPAGRQAPQTMRASVNIAGPPALRGAVNGLDPAPFFKRSDA